MWGWSLESSDRGREGVGGAGRWEEVVGVGRDKGRVEVGVRVVGRRKGEIGGWWLARQIDRW